MACSCSVFARPSQNKPPCGTMLAAVTAALPAVFVARFAVWPIAASNVRLTVSFSSLSGPMLKLGWRSRYISEGTARTPCRDKSGPPYTAGVPSGGPYACAGLWQLAQDGWPEDKPATRRRTPPAPTGPSPTMVRQADEPNAPETGSRHAREPRQRQTFGDGIQAKAGNGGGNPRRRRKQQNSRYRWPEAGPDTISRRNVVRVKRAARSADCRCPDRG